MKHVPMLQSTHIVTSPRHLTTLVTPGVIYLGDHRKAVRYHEQTLQMWRSIYGEGIAQPDIATSFNNLGYCWSDLGDYRKAVRYHELALQMWRSVYVEIIAHPHIAGSLNNLVGSPSGLAAVGRSDPRKSLSYHEQALLMRRSIYGEGIAHPDIVSSFESLCVVVCSLLGDHRKATYCYVQFTRMKQIIYN
ncbi:hypothetical protein Bbelb_295550 [Branchiostoma belcheri]|nr:hypothetical protein Bbelb_295550 [Branchiostoma belcheri]